MKTIEIVGYKRANLGKAESRRLRSEGYVPCVAYGGNDQVHFYAPMILFRDLVYTNEAHFVHLNIEGQESQAILQEVQFHPVSEVILHADFLRIEEGRKIKMDIPIRLVGQAKGVSKGGTLIRKRATLKVYGFPKQMPDHIDVDVTNLDFHNAVKVRDMSFEGLEFLDPGAAAIAAVEVPRAAKLATETSATEAAPAAAEAKKPEAPKKEEGKK
ncbi:MAG: 50S ribosomal protein L25/general stress protein Ctc [Cyclobacteriaceae bacterium]|jgi:large subunit ribosomal protein L25|nr:50S ribosomal protein L25/general stress protein Ctc [Cyclobacteriaceae bacterium]